jgi:hypothetical protein
MTLPVASPVSDFDRALEHDRDSALSLLRAELGQFDRAEEIAQLLADIYELLRTPIHPHHHGRDLVAAEVARAAREGADALTLRGVLASPTAHSELPFFLRLAELFRARLPTRLEFLLVRWDDADDPADEEGFHRIAEGVRRTVDDGGWPPDAVEPVDVQSARPGEPPVTAPDDFALAWREVEHAAAGGSTPVPRLDHDLKWITGFYERQRSLRRHGDRQPLFDLALRRGIGRRLSRREPESPQPLIIASELHHRFLPCYDASVPILDVDVTRDSRGGT